MLLRQFNFTHTFLKQILFTKWFPSNSLVGFLNTSLIGLFWSAAFLEIYRIVSQKQIRDPHGHEDNSTADVKAIHVEPTVNADNVRKQCCQQ